MSQRYDFFKDPGHGWLRVPVQELHELGIAGQISRYSYRNGTVAYLEEDCDLEAFCAAKRLCDHTWSLESHMTIHSTDVLSDIRDFKPYR